jgi:cytochrome c-type biogenesis protein
MGASIDFFSDIFFDFKKELNFISGILIILLGLYFIGIIKIPFLDLEHKFKLQGLQNNYFFPFLIGMAFAFGWSPCIGPILGSVLAIAINDSISGTILLSFYSLGLALPFILVGLMMSKLMIMIRYLNRYIRYFQLTTGIILLLTGVFIFNGTIQSIGFKLNFILPSLEMLLI